MLNQSINLECLACSTVVMELLSPAAQHTTNATEVVCNMIIHQASVHPRNVIVI